MMSKSCMLILRAAASAKDKEMRFRPINLTRADEDEVRELKTYMYTAMNEKMQNLSQTK